MSFTREDIIGKVQKLLKLAESTNVNEAAAAAAKAQELMDRFEIEAASLQAESVAPKVNEPVETASFDSNGRMEKWRGSLLHVLCDTNGCKSYQSREGKESFLKVIGRKTDAQTVRYMFQALVSVVEGLAVGQRGQGRKFIASFKLGATSAITQRLRESKQATRQAVYQEAAQLGTQALMRVDNAVAVMAARDAALARHMAEQMLRFRSSGAARVTNSSGYHQGYAAGQRADIGAGGRQLGAGRSSLPA